MAAVLTTARARERPRGFESHALRTSPEIQALTCAYGDHLASTLIHSRSRSVPLRPAEARWLCRIRVGAASQDRPSGHVLASSSWTDSAASIRRLAASSCPSMHLAYTFSRTCTLCPAHSATWGAGTPAFSHSETAAWRRS